MIELTLSYPVRVLWPNARPHWGTKARAVKKHRHEGQIVALEAGARRFNAKAARITLTVYPPTRNRPDEDNAKAAMKAAMDGIADALGIDDSNFTFAPTAIAEPVKGGAVRVRIEEA